MPESLLFGSARSVRLAFLVAVTSPSFSLTLPVHARRTSRRACILLVPAIPRILGFFRPPAAVPDSPRSVQHKPAVPNFPIDDCPFSQPCLSPTFGLFSHVSPLLRIELTFLVKNISGRTPPSFLAETQWPFPVPLRRPSAVMRSFSVVLSFAFYLLGCGVVR